MFTVANCVARRVARPSSKKNYCLSEFGVRSLSCTLQSIASKISAEAGDARCAAEIRFDFKSLKNNPPQVAIIMGRDSDWPTLKPAAEVCAEFGVPCEVRVVSAFRNPLDMVRFAHGAQTQPAGHHRWRGRRGAPDRHGREPHATPRDRRAGGKQIVEGTRFVAAHRAVDIGGGRNADLLAVRILGAGDEALRKRMASFQSRLAVESQAKNRKLQSETSIGGSR